MRAETVQTSRHDRAAAMCTASWQFHRLLRMRKDFSATATREPPLRPLTRRPNYMIFPGQPPSSDGEDSDRVLPTLIGKLSHPLNFSPAPSIPPLRMFLPSSPTLTGTGTLRILPAGIMGRRGRESGTRIGRVFFNDLRAASSSSLDPTPISHVLPVQDSPTPSPASFVQRPRTTPIDPSRR